MRFKVCGKLDGSDEFVTATVTAKDIRHARQVAFLKGVKVNDISVEGDFYDRLWANATPLIRCDECHRWHFLRPLVFRRHCRRCRRTFAANARAMHAELTRIQQQLHEDCVAALLNLARAGNNTNENLQAVIGQYSAQGLKDTERAFSHFVEIWRVEQIKSGVLPTIDNSGITLKYGEWCIMFSIRRSCTNGTSSRKSS